MQNISDPFIRAGCKNLKKLSIVCAMVIIILITSFAPTHFIKKDFIVGVNLVNAPYYLSVPDQDSILTAMQNAGVRVIRAGLPSNQRGFDFARRVYSHGMKIALLVDVQFTKGTPWPVTPKGFKGLWRSPPLSKADPDVFRAYFAPLLARLEETGIVISSFELGNEINWAGFNADFSLPGQGRVLVADDLLHDPEGRQIAKGYLRYLKVLAVLKDIRDHSKLNRLTPIISAGLANLDGSTWPNHIKADAVGPNATLNFFRANGMDSLVDGYGLHFYPSPYKHGDAAGPVAMLAHIQLNGLLECKPTGSGKGKPAWITEWGFNTAYSGCPVNDSIRTMLVTDIRNEFKTYVQQGRIKGIFFYTWQGTYHAIKEDYSSAFRCGKLTNSGKIAISPM